MRSSFTSVNVLSGTLRRELLRQSRHNLSHWTKKNAEELWILMGLMLCWGHPDFTGLNRIRRRSRQERRGSQAQIFEDVNIADSIESYLVPRQETRSFIPRWSAIRGFTSFQSPAPTYDQIPMGVREVHTYEGVSERPEETQETTLILETQNPLFSEQQDV